MPCGAPGALSHAVSRDPEASLLADHHQLHAFDPTGDQALQRVVERLIACELSNITVGQPV
jgi:hypothetical protein